MHCFGVSFLGYWWLGRRYQQWMPPLLVRREMDEKDEKGKSEMVRGRKGQEVWEVKGIETGK